MACSLHLSTQFVSALAGGLTVVIAMLVVTPVCGWLFHCGCSWPWAGLDDGCNYHAVQALEKCPWCASLFAGFASVGLSIAAGFWAALRLPIPARVSDFRLPRPGAVVVDLSLRIFAGMTVFAALAGLTGWLFAVWQGYSYFALSPGG